MKKITASFDILVQEEAFLKAVSSVTGCDENNVTEENIAQFLNQKLEPLNSNNVTFEIVGGDTEGNFIQNVDAKDIL